MVVHELKLQPDEHKPDIAAEAISKSGNRYEVLGVHLRYLLVCHPGTDVVQLLCRKCWNLTSSLGGVVGRTCDDCDIAQRRCDDFRDSMLKRHGIHVTPSIADHEFGDFEYDHDVPVRREPTIRHGPWLKFGKYETDLPMLAAVARHFGIRSFPPGCEIHVPKTNDGATLIVRGPCDGTPPKFLLRDGSELVPLEVDGVASAKASYWTLAWDVDGTVLHKLLLEAKATLLAQRAETREQTQPPTFTDHVQRELRGPIQ